MRTRPIDALRVNQRLEFTIGNQERLVGQLPQAGAPDYAGARLL
jgi:hypothetical protein